MSDAKPELEQFAVDALRTPMYVANKEQIRAMIDGTDTEVGRIGNVAVTRARNLMVLAVPENCIGELEPGLTGCKKAGA